MWADPKAIVKELVKEALPYVLIAVISFVLGALAYPFILKEGVYGKDKNDNDESITESTP